MSINSFSTTPPQQPQPPSLLNTSLSEHHEQEYNSPLNDDQPLLSSCRTSPNIYSAMTKTSDQQSETDHQHHPNNEHDQQQQLLLYTQNTDIFNNRSLNTILDHTTHNYQHHVPLFSIYTVHALCTFDERVYEFASYFFIMEIFKTTLLPMSIYGFSTTVSGILLSTTIGSLVDTTPRLIAVQSFLIAQKFTTILGALGFWILLVWFDPSSQTQVPISIPKHDLSTSISTESSLPWSMSLYQGYSLFAFLVLASGILKLSALGWSISIERDWIVALCQSNSDMLTKINVAMKRIDLICKLVSPIIFAALLSQFNSSQTGAGYCSLAIAVWCIFSFTMELYLIRTIWFNSPILWEPRLLQCRDTLSKNHKSWKRNPSQPRANETIAVVEELEEGEVRGLLDARDCSASDLKENRYRPNSILSKGVRSFREYAHHIVFLASLSYAIIYINLMSVSGTMIGFLQWKGFSAGSIALLKGICTGSELLGTILMPILMHYVGLVRSGAWSIWFEVFTLTPVLLSLYTDRLPIQVVIFVGMALSRIGVWSFDLVITQILQEYIEGSSNNAGVINGWHYSTMSLFELAQFILTMVWSDPQQYFIPCTLSFICVVIGAIVYTAHLARMRGHLFHYHRIASAASSHFVSSECGDNDEEEEINDSNVNHIDYNQPGPSRPITHRHRQNNEIDI